MGEDKKTLNYKELMTYVNITINDKRIRDALELGSIVAQPNEIFDFGAGDGLLCKSLAQKFKNAHIFCYEPEPSLRSEAERNLENLSNVSVISDLKAQQIGRINLLYCLEVFEHLPEKQTQEALLKIKELLAKDGIAIIGVPIEIHVPAIYKGLFRMIRRYGAFDAMINILKAIIGCPLKERPCGEIAPGFPYHYRHIGFDYRVLAKLLSTELKILKTIGSPFNFLGTLLNSEIFFVVQKKSS